MNAKDAYRSQLRELPRCPHGLTGWAMHRQAHMAEALAQVGTEAPAVQYERALMRSVEECEVCYPY